MEHEREQRVKRTQRDYSFAFKMMVVHEVDWSVHPYFQTIQGMQVSAHLLILRSGEVLQFVNFNDRAWHAGRSSYLGKKRVQ